MIESLVIPFPFFVNALLLRSEGDTLTINNIEFEKVSWIMSYKSQSIVLFYEPVPRSSLFPSYRWQKFIEFFQSFISIPSDSIIFKLVVSVLYVCVNVNDVHPFGEEALHFAVLKFILFIVSGSGNNQFLGILIVWRWIEGNVWIWGSSSRVLCFSRYIRCTTTF